MGEAAEKAAQLRREASRLRSQADRLVRLAAELDDDQGDEDKAQRDAEARADVVRRLTIAGEV